MTELIQDTRVVVIAVIAVIAARPKDQEQQQQLHGISREFTSAPSGESSSSKLNERTNVSTSDHSIPFMSSQKYFKSMLSCITERIVSR